MGYAIERLSFSGLFDQSFRLLRDHFVTLTTGFALIYVPMGLASAMVQLAGGTASTEAMLGAAAIGLVALIVMPLFQLAASISIAEAYLSQPTSFGPALKRASTLYLPYLGTFSLIFLAMIPLALLLVVPALYFGVCWMLVGPVAVVEGIFGTRGMARSRALVRSHWGRGFAVLLLAGVATGILSSAFELIFGAIPVLGPLLSGAVQAVIATYSATVVFVLYVDLRCRNEAFDLQLLAQQVAHDRSGMATSSAQGPDATA